MHRAVILLGLLVAASGALLGAQGGQPVAAASIVVGGVLVVVAGLWLRRRRSRDEEPRHMDVAETASPPRSPAVAIGSRPTEPLRLWPAEAEAAAVATAPPPAEAPTAPPPAEAPVVPVEEPETRERQAIREAELAREAELNAIADELRALRSRDLSSIHIPEWKARIETWVEADLKARAERGEEVTPQAAEWMRDFGEIPVKDWRRHMLRHLRRLGYRNYREGEW